MHKPEWTDAQNANVFGLCANPAGHGHNYTLEVSVSGALDPATGMIMNLRELKDLVGTEIILDIDHKNLNVKTVKRMKKTNLVKNHDGS